MTYVKLFFHSKLALSFSPHICPLPYMTPYQTTIHRVFVPSNFWRLYYLYMHKLLYILHKNSCTYFLLNLYSSNASTKCSYLMETYLTRISTLYTNPSFKYLFNVVSFYFYLVISYCSYFVFIYMTAIYYYRVSHFYSIKLSKTKHVWNFPVILVWFFVFKGMMRKFTEWAIFFLLDSWFTYSSWMEKSLLFSKL